MPITLPPLPYARDALAPHVSSETLDYHYGKHHQAYVDNLNGLVDGSDDDLEKIILDAEKEGKQGVFNNAAQVWNHTFYWHSMTPTNGGGAPAAGSKIANGITASFGSYDAFKGRLRDGRQDAVWVRLGMAGRQRWQARSAQNPEC